MNFARLAAITRAISAGCGAFADSLDGQLSQAPANVSPHRPPADTQPDGAPSPAAPMTPDEAFKQAFAMAMAGGPPPTDITTRPRRRRQRRLARHLPSGEIGPDWTDSDGLGAVLSQAGTCEALGLSRGHVLLLEQGGRLKRELSRGRVCYRYEQVMRLAEMMRAHAAGNQHDAAQEKTDVS